MIKFNKDNGLSSYQQLVVNEPSRRFVLWIIANDPKAFSSTFLLEVGTALSSNSIKPDPNSNIAKALAIFQHLVVINHVKMVDAFTNKVTIKGYFYRLHTSHSFRFWGTLIGGIAASMAIYAGLSKVQEKSIPSEPKSKPQIENVQPLNHQKSGDTNRKKPLDTSYKK